MFASLVKDLFKVVILKKVVTSNKILSNAQTFNSYFRNKIKDLYIYLISNFH